MNAAAVLPVLIADHLMLRMSTVGDAAALANAYTRNRDHLRPWDPERPDRFYTEEGQREILETQSYQSRLHTILVDNDTVIGTATLSGIAHKAFQSAQLGYWMDERWQGQRLMTAVVGHILRWARDDLRLHRIEAATLIHNVASQRVLEANGFTMIGTAPRYLHIAGRWQDHRLFQALLHSF